MPNSGQPGNAGNLTTGDTIDDVKTQSAGTGDSSPPADQSQPDAKALQAQLDRLKEDLERERETSRLLQSYLQTNQQPQHRPAADDDEFKDVDKTLGPWVERRLKPYVDQFAKVLTNYHDKLDSLQFVVDLINADPELAERLNPGIPIDEIDRYRFKVAQEENRYISRTNALGLLKGMRAITEEKKSRLSKRQQAVVDDSIRKAAADTATSTEDKPPIKPSGGANPALDKLRSGGRLSAEDLKKAREALEDVAI